MKSNSLFESCALFCYDRSTGAELNSVNWLRFLNKGIPMLDIVVFRCHCSPNCSSDMKPKDVIYSNGKIPVYSSGLTFNGLSLSSRPDWTLLDGLGGHNWWWWSVGFNKFE